MKNCEAGRHRSLSPNKHNIVFVVGNANMLLSEISLLEDLSTSLEQHPRIICAMLTQCYKRQRMMQDMMPLSSMWGLMRI